MESNPARVFLSENLTVSPEATVRCGSVYENYVTWSKQSGYEPLNASQFGKEVGKQFPTVKRTRVTTETHRSWHYMGLDYQAHVPTPAKAFPVAALEGVE